MPETRPYCVSSGNNNPKLVTILDRLTRRLLLETADERHCYHLPAAKRYPWHNRNRQLKPHAPCCSMQHLPWSCHHKPQPFHHKPPQHPTTRDHHVHQPLTETIVTVQEKDEEEGHREVPTHLVEAVTEVRLEALEAQEDLERQMTRMMTIGMEGQGVEWTPMIVTTIRTEAIGVIVDIRWIGSCWKSPSH